MFKIILLIKWLKFISYVNISLKEFNKGGLYLNREGNKLL